MVLVGGGRPLGRWKDRINELEQAMRESLDRERWKLFCRGHHLEGHSQREQGVRAIV